MLHRQGRTLAVDTDPQGSLMAWSSGLPFTVISLPVRDVHRRLSDLAADYDHVVIDTPPGDTAIIRSAVMAVPLVIVPRKHNRARHRPPGTDLGDPERP